MLLRVSAFVRAYKFPSTTRVRVSLYTPTESNQHVHQLDFIARSCILGAPRVTPAVQLLACRRCRLACWNISLLHIDDRHKAEALVRPRRLGGIVIPADQQRALPAPMVDVEVLAGCAADDVEGCRLGVAHLMQPPVKVLVVRVPRRQLALAVDYSGRVDGVRRLGVAR